MNEIQSCFKRCEQKYLLTRAQYKAFKQGMAQYMIPDLHPRYSVRNVYFDTEHNDLIRASLEKPVYKEKLRLRSYGVPGSGNPVFVEIKKKFQGVVYKRRITVSLQDAAGYLAGTPVSDGSQISREIDWFLQFYRPQPKVFIAYEREAWAAADGGALRLTFDTQLRARSNELTLDGSDEGLPLLDRNLILMEIKIPGAAPLWLSRLLSENKIYPTSFSKYGAYYQNYVLGGKPTVIAKEVVRSA